MALRTKALYRNVGEAIAILTDLLVAADFTDEQRIEDLLAERKNDLLASVIPSGHIMAKRLAAAPLSPVAFREEQWGGRTQLLRANATLEAFRRHPASVIEKLLQLRDTIVQKWRLIVNLTADQEGLSIMERELPQLVSRLRTETHPEHAVPMPPTAEKKHWGIIVPAEVSYVAGAIPAPYLGAPEEAPLRVAQKFLANGYLYRAIRVQGGAYGGSCTYDAGAGLFAFISYRDPHIVETVNTYRQAITAFRGECIDAEELDKAVIATIGAIDTPMDPADKGWTALQRYVIGITDEYRQTLREQILEMDPDHLSQAVGKVFEEAKDRMVIAVLGSEDRLKEAAKLLDVYLEIEPLLGKNGSPG